MESLATYIAIDVIVVATVIFLMLPRMTFWHPLSVYLLFHIYSFTLRAYEIFNGAPTIYHGWQGAEDVTAEELSRAMALADFALIIFAFGSWIAHRLFEARAGFPIKRRVLNKSIVKVISLICLPVGIFFFVIIKTSTPLDLSLGGYGGSATLWPVGISCMLIFAFGFRWYLVLFVSIFLGLAAFQGYHRFMLVLPLLFLAALYLQRRGRRWPTISITIVAVILALIFPRLKYIGGAIQSGDTKEALFQLSQSFSKDTSQFGTKVSESFLDQYAISLTLIDYHDGKLWGSSYFSLITLPIPRQWWPQKPALNEHVKEISSPTRQFGREGRIITYLGESYINFGYAGFVIIPGLLGYVLTSFCLYATAGPMQRLGRYSYLVFFAAFIQGFRDGLYSFILFTFAHNIPFLISLGCHYLPGLAAKSLDRPPADQLALQEEIGHESR